MTARGWKAKLRADIKREHRRAAKEQIAELRAKIHQAKADKKRALLDARARCKRDRVAVRVLLAEKRARILRELREHAAAERQAARDTCTAGLLAARELGGRVATARAKLAAERTYRRELRRIEAGNRASSAAARSSARERTQESDDEVRSNIPDEYRPLFERVKRGIKGSGRISRSEAFMHYVEAHPAEMTRALEDKADRLIRELEGQERAARRSLRQGPSPEAYATPF